ncbi:MAG: 2-oxoglutarate dehydrogenase complex dihydrolipoyllysine-residue succinyltransferase [Bacteriovoracaceae bacterium]
MIDIKIPSIGESITEVTLTSWLKTDGEYIAEGDLLCEIESDKATVELPAESSGTLKIMAEEGAELEIGAVIAQLDPSGEASAGAAPKEDTPAPVEAAPATPAPSSNSGAGIASPAARKILDEKGVSSNDVSGTGKDGRITKADALGASAKPASNNVVSMPAAETAPPQAGGRGVRTEKMTRLRKTIAKRLVEAKNETAMLTTFNEVDMSAVMDIRKKYKESFKDKFEVGLGFMSFFTKACCLALKEVPGVNAQISGEEIVYHDYMDVGIAVSTPKGLVVPVIRNAESLSLHEIEKEIIRLAMKGREGKLSLDEMQGGTFTITNGGIFGSMLSTPIINIPQSAILGMHNIVQRPVAVNGEVKIRPIMYLALSYDHRIVDGRESVTFLKRVKEYLEDPSRMLIGV